MIIYLKRLKSSKFVRVKAFPMYGGIGLSAPSLLSLPRARIRDTLERSCARAISENRHARNRTRDSKMASHIAETSGSHKVAF